MTSSTTQLEAAPALGPPGGGRLRVACLGAGASGTALLIAAVRAVEAQPSERRRTVGSALALTFVEPETDLGPGLPYGTQAGPFHLMNMESSTVSVISSAPADFVDWLLANRASLPEDLDTDDEVAEGFVRRHTFGRYLRERFDEHMRRARALGIEVRLVRARAVRVLRTPDGLVVSLADGTYLAADRVVLATGHWRPHHADHCHDPGRHPPRLLFPWPAADLVAGLASAATIGVLGTSLTAVDTVLTIAHARGAFARDARGGVDYQRSGPAFRLSLMSRNGLLPTVRAARPPGYDSANPYLAPQVLPELGEHPGFADCASVRTRQRAALSWSARAAGTSPVPSTTADEGPLATDRTGPAHAELRAALALRHADDLAWSTHQLTTRLFFRPLSWFYGRMVVPERVLLERSFLSRYLVEAAAMPLVTAEKIEALLRAGVLTVHAGVDRVVHGPAGEFAVSLTTPGARPAVLRVPVLVNAIGRSRVLTPDAGPAYRAVADGLLAADPLGGISVDLATGLACAPDGTVVPDLAALGPLTTGSYLGASGVYACAKFADLVAARWVGELAGRLVRQGR